jgi:hypothetical protein
MDLAAVGWIALGWFAVALVLSLVLGGFLRKVSETPSEDDLIVAASKQQVMRFMRGRKRTNTRGNAATQRGRELGKRVAG